MPDDMYIVIIIIISTVVVYCIMPSSLLPARPRFVSYCVSTGQDSLRCEIDEQFHFAVVTLLASFRDWFRFSSQTKHGCSPGQINRCDSIFSNIRLAYRFARNSWTAIAGNFMSGSHFSAEMVGCLAAVPNVVV